MNSEKQVELPFLAKALVLLLPTILLLVLAEWLAAGYLKNRFGDDFDLVSQATGQMAPSGYQLWEHPKNYWAWAKLSRYNNLGFLRLQDTAIEKPAGVVRIFIMGGSAALGSSANPGYPWLQMSGQGAYSIDEKISSYLEIALNKKYPQRTFEVINAATNWSQLHQQMLHYFRKIRYLEPDLVISIDGQNDVLRIEDEYLGSWDQSRQVKVPMLESNIRVKMRPLISRSNLLFLAAGTIFGQKALGSQVSDSELVQRYVALGKPQDYEARVDQYMADNRRYVDRGVQSYLNDLQHFNDALIREGTKGIFIQQSQLLMDATKPLTDIENGMRNYIYNDAYNGYTRNFWRELETAGLELRAIEDVPFYSFLNIFEQEEGEVYIDYTHLTPRGNEIVAEKLIPIIEARYPELLSVQ